MVQAPQVRMEKMEPPDVTETPELLVNPEKTVLLEALATLALKESPAVTVFPVLTDPPDLQVLTEKRETLVSQAFPEPQD